MTVQKKTVTDYFIRLDAGELDLLHSALGAAAEDWRAAKEAAPTLRTNSEFETLRVWTAMIAGWLKEIS